MAYSFVLAQDFTKALEVADEAIKLALDEIWIQENRAHALMLLGRADEARDICLRHRGETNVLGEKSWEPIVVDDFAEMRKAGLTHPLMNEISESFGPN